MITNRSAFTKRFTLKTGGNPYVLTGKNLAMRISKGPDLPSVLSITTANSKIVIVDAVNGVIDLILSETDMANFQPGTYIFEIGWTNAPSGYTRLFGGRIAISGAPAS